MSKQNICLQKKTRTPIPWRSISFRNFMKLSKKIIPYSLLIANFQIVTKAIIEQNIPLIEEYDFLNDKVNAALKIELKPSTKIRHYQVLFNSLNLGKSTKQCVYRGESPFWSDCIALWCRYRFQTGKTLVGIVATTTVKRKPLFSVIQILQSSNGKPSLNSIPISALQRLSSSAPNILKKIKYSKINKEAQFF